MADDDPEIWHAIHRLAAVMDSMDMENEFLHVGVNIPGFPGKVDQDWGKENEHDEAKPYVITHQNGKTLKEKLALQADLKKLLVDAAENIKHWQADYGAHVQKEKADSVAKKAQDKADAAQRKAEEQAKKAREKADAAKAKASRR
jgi:hypothetical protein